MDARIHIKKQKGNGVYTLLISAVSNCAAKDPDMLKYKDIEIDFNAGKVISVADHNSIGTETFPAMKSLGDLPGQRLVVIGIGGGSDGIQAKLIAELAEKHGKQVVGTVSVRTKYTTFDSRDVPKGTERSIKSPADALGNDTYLLAPHSEGVHFDRFLENAVADSKTSYLVLDAMKESQTEEENVANLSQQFQQLFQRLQPDMIIALDTGGDALYQENVATESSKSTPDQDLRVIKALNLLNIPSLTMEVATGVDSPVNAQQVLNKAEASYFSPSSEDRRYLLARYHELGMDAATANEKRFGKTALAWQIAMNNGEEKGYHFLPVPASRILDEKSPWNPVVFLEPAMQGVFVMDLRKHVAAISQQPVAKEVEPSPQARL
jgi:hypothetical protein